MKRAWLASDLVESVFAARGVKMPYAVLRLPTVRARTGLSRSTIYFHVSQGAFPTLASLGGRAVGGIETEVNA